MVDTRYMNRGSGFFCDKFDNVFANEFLYKKAWYHFGKELSECLVNKLLIERNMADCLAGTILARMDYKYNTIHNPLFVLSMLDFAKKHRIMLEDWEELAIWFSHCVYMDGEVSHITYSKPYWFIENLMFVYVNSTKHPVFALIERTMKTLDNVKEPYSQKVYDLLNWYLASSSHSYESVFKLERRLSKNVNYLHDRAKIIDAKLISGDTFKSAEMSRFNKVFENNEIKFRKLYPVI